MTVPKEDGAAVARFFAASPAWTGVARAAEITGFSDRVLLHSGPPAEPGFPLVKPTINSAAVACVYEGWARSLDEADALITSGGIRFAPAQDHRVATPLAAVVSPSMKVLTFADRNDPARRSCAPVNGGGTGAAHAPRYGRRSQEAIDLLRFLNDDVAPAIAPAAADPIPWFPLVDEALTRGDDAHLRHLEAHKLLVEILRTRLGAAFAGGKVGTFVAEFPIFHLNFWMAAARLALGAAEGVAGSGFVTAFGGNGARFGLQVSAMPRRWFTVPAEPPLGKVRDPYVLADCTGAYGDSALAEAFGLGAMAHAYCPDMRALHKDFTPPDLLALPERLLLAEHPAFPRSRARAGLSVHAVVAARTAPVVELGLVHAAGLDGGLGAGLYRPPLALFETAQRAIVAGG
ncbi:MAG: DUF1116 domain-containing protein [Alphaproteobacteria bacterium]|nr:DUF1116 domain-containing protein [Alphaproteobacteria bacterium]